jgi:hypothetical protein
MMRIQREEPCIFFLVEEQQDSTGKMRITDEDENDER